ncbi:MAG TPA: SDR family NAD(P)-dependent oxidoreductase [Steroidobacteraceae bacterium]|nr:SDR family NAD(P)-dependent oxidoreductase [Steroidobacteraceae bacterium]
MKDVAGRVAFITGGGSGIGLGMARVFAAAGMKVVVADVRQDHLDEALKQLKAAGREAYAIKLDVADRTAVARAADETIRVFGKVHLVCNNAGVSLFGPMDQATYEDWDWMMGVNFNGVVNGCMSFVPKIKAHGEGGHIVNTASMAGLLVGPGFGIYSASKFAVRGLTEALRLDLAPHRIGVSVLCPGFVRSNIHESVLSRPQALAKSGYQVTAEDMKRLDDLLNVGMAPDEVGERVLAGIRRNDLFLLTHAEFRDELKGIFDAMLAALPDEPPNPGRMTMEDLRRARKAEAAAVADKL